jgi:uncharacterized protein YutE (UPF0331/DUF86 family)
VTVVDSGAAADLRDTARFRNLLVHGYAKVDDTRVVEILRDRVDDLAAFSHRSRPSRKRLTARNPHSHRPEPGAART